MVWVFSMQALESEAPQQTIKICICSRSRDSSSYAIMTSIRELASKIVSKFFKSLLSL